MTDPFLSASVRQEIILGFLVKEPETAAASFAATDDFWPPLKEGASETEANFVDIVRKSLEVCAKTITTLRSQIRELEGKVRLSRPIEVHNYTEENKAWVGKALKYAAESDPPVTDTLRVVLNTEPNAAGIILDWALENRWSDLVALLDYAGRLRSWDEVDHVMKLQGKRPIHRDGSADNIQRPLERAASIGDLICFKALSNRMDADFQQSMVEACEQGHFELVKYILELRVPGVDAKTDSSVYLRLAARGNRGSLGDHDEECFTKIVRLLLENGADKNAINPTHPEQSALSGACHWGNFENVKTLLDAGADPNIYDGEPLRQSQNYPHIAKLLIERGAKKPNQAFLEKLISLGRARVLQVLFESFTYGTEDFTPLFEGKGTNYEAVSSYPHILKMMVDLGAPAPTVS